MNPILKFLKVYCDPVKLKEKKCLKVDIATQTIGIKILFVCSETSRLGISLWILLLDKFKLWSHITTKKNSLQQQTKETQTLITGTLGTNINGLHLNEIVLSPFPNEKNTQTIISGAVFLRSDSLCLNYN